MEGEVQGALGAHGGVGGAIPANQRLVVPQAQLAPPPVAALGDRDGPLGVELEHLASLVHLQGMGVDAGGAVLPGLPGAPPLAGEVEVVGHLPGQLVHGPHDLRHTFATWLEDGGIPARVIDELMGHQASRSQDRSGSTIGLRYRHMTPAMQARVMTVIEQHMATALAGMPQVCPKTEAPASDEEAEPEAYQA